MPFRTRDFLLFMMTVAFLLIGITSTAQMDIAKRSQEASVINFETNNEEVVYLAVLPESEDDPRPSRLAALREKIADMVLTTTEEPEAEVIAEVEAVDSSVNVVPGAINLCSNYTTITPSWSASNLLFEIVEGARIVYRNVVINQVVGSSTTNIPSREVVLQLPLRTFPLAEKTCLSNDVVGVALDGSLIRNNEHTLYRVFGEETLVGYALDGFPIYGVNDQIKTDECGGAISSGEYKYYLSTEREGVLGCFGGMPVSL